VNVNKGAWPPSSPPKAPPPTAVGLSNLPVMATPPAATQTQADVDESLYEELTLTVDKESLGTKMGLLLCHEPGVDGTSGLPFVATIAPHGVAANPEAQLQGVLMQGDRLTKMEGLTSVLRIDFEGKTSEAAREAAATPLLLGKALGEIKIGIERDGSRRVVSVRKEHQEDPLGLKIESKRRGEWAHPCIFKVYKGPCKGIIEVGDLLWSIEAATEFATLNTHHESQSHTVATAFIKAAIGPVKITVRRIKDWGARHAWLEAATAKATEPDYASTDTALIKSAQDVDIDNDGQIEDWELEKMGLKPGKSKAKRWASINKLETSQEVAQRAADDALKI